MQHNVAIRVYFGGNIPPNIDDFRKVDDFSKIANTPKISRKHTPKSMWCVSYILVRAKLKEVFFRQWKT